jgi:hypothetical protein
VSADGRTAAAGLTVVAPDAGRQRLAAPADRDRLRQLSGDAGQYDGAINGRALKNNSSFASLIDEAEPPRYARYIRHIRSFLLDDLGFRNRRILVLGAGGFTLSHREASNHYTYVDIDPAVRAIAETHFLAKKQTASSSPTTRAAS